MPSATAPVWRHEIANIIAETERNLGMKASMRAGAAAHAAPRAPLSTLSGLSSATGGFTTRAEHISGPSAAPMMERPLADTKTSLAVAAAVPTIAAEASARYHAGAASAAAASAAAASSAFEATAAATTMDARANSQRLLETVKFELDVRGSMAEKQLEAVREEMQASMLATEKKWVDIARAVEASVGGQIEAESKLRTHCEQSIHALRDAANTAHSETLRVVGEFQQTAIDHSEVLRRLDRDLTAFRTTTETKLAQAAGGVAQCVENQQHLARRLEQLPPPAMAAAGDAAAGAGAAMGGAMAGAGAGLPAGSGEARLADLEAGLRAERDFRKTLEAEVMQAREQVAPSNIMVTVEEVVSTALERGAGGTGVASAAAVASLDEKVKECGRLIVRMGTPPPPPPPPPPCRALLSPSHSLPRRLFLPTPFSKGLAHAPSHAIAHHRLLLLCSEAAPTH